jgi:hypothetical protein
MTSPGYRSYVIRAWTASSEGDARARVRIEVVDSGAEIDLRGIAASRLAAAVEAAIRDASRELVGDGASGGEPVADEPVSDRPPRHPTAPG